MNAAFLILTSAWLAGADPAPAAAPAAPAAPAVVSTGSGCGGCGSTCGDSCCDPCARKHHLNLGSRLHGLFHRNKGCCADPCAPAPTCCAPKPVCCPAPKPVCCPAPKPVCCPAPKPVCCPAPKPVCCPAPKSDCCDPCAKKERRHLLAGIFHRKSKDCCGGCDSCCGSAAPATAPATPDSPKKMPTTIGATPTIINPARIGEEGVRNPFDLARRYHGKASASADYSKLTGQLFFVHTDGGRWVVRYAPISQEDRFGGSVILARDVPMDAFNEGDLISVEGEVLQEKSGLPLGGALYRAAKLNLVERGQGLASE